LDSDAHGIPAVQRVHGARSRSLLHHGGAAAAVAWRQRA